MPDGEGATRLSLYDDTAQRAADVLVRRYSTSFGLATRLLPGAQRTHVRDVYALVRLADEVVDGASAEAGADRERSRVLLDELEARTEAAMATGYSTDVLVHAFARTAREVGITTDLTRPFFASMRTDLDTTVHDEESLATYIYGSAEVVGLMCLRVFLSDLPAEWRETMYRELGPGAQALGAAFQKINFLRDLAEDGAVLGRRYLVGIDPRAVTEEQKKAALADIDEDLAVARTALTALPAGPRRAVAVAFGLFSELAARLRATPAAELSRSRVAVPGPVKARVAATAVLRGSR
ncbi:phytoene/squalene synthase family protein [Actinotalea lenta]|uniref:phytoene/squalene synthase family protein n=1 Tax=Actinotalea lenta TaxID=3064654 RepID=UPI00272B5218|nr:squalene/phytoene synthase family protein [Isoptericola sp. b490]